MRSATIVEIDWPSKEANYLTTKKMCTVSCRPSSVPQSDKTMRAQICLVFAENKDVVPVKEFQSPLEGIDYVNGVAIAQDGLVEFKVKPNTLSSYHCGAAFQFELTIGKDKYYSSAFITILTKVRSRDRSNKLDDVLTANKPYSESLEDTYVDDQLSKSSLKRKKRDDALETVSNEVSVSLLESALETLHSEPTMDSFSLAPSIAASELEVDDFNLDDLRIIYNTPYCTRDNIMQSLQRIESFQGQIAQEMANIRELLKTHFISDMPCIN